MRTIILTIGTLACLLGIVFFFSLGMMVMGGNPLMGIAAILGGCPIFGALAIVFDYVREQLDPSDPLTHDRPFPFTRTRSAPVSDLARTPWAKNASHQNKE